MAGGIQSKFLQAPIRGMDFRVPLLGMPAEYSPMLINAFVENGAIIKSWGHQIETSFSGATNFPLVIHYEGRYIVAQNSLIDDDSTTNAVSATVVSSTDWCLHAGRICLADSAGTVRLVNTSTLASTAGPIFNGAGTGSTPRRPICSYKTSLYVGEDYTLSYSNAGSIANVAMNTFDLTYLINTPVAAIGTFPAASGAADDELFVIASRGGDILVYSGASPASWSLVQRFKVTTRYVASLDKYAEAISLPNDLLINYTIGGYCYSIKELMLGGATTGGASTLAPVMPLFNSMERSEQTLYKTMTYWPTRDAIVIYLTGINATSSGYAGQLTYDWAGFLSPYGTAASMAIVIQRGGAMTFHSVSDNTGLGSGANLMGSPTSCSLVPADRGVLYPSKTVTTNVAGAAHLFSVDEGTAWGDALTTVICLAPLPNVGGRQKRISQLAMYSNWSSSHALSLAIKDGYDTGYSSSGAGSPVSITTTNSDDFIIRRNILQGVGVGPNAVIQLFEANTTIDFTYYGMEAFYEEGDIY